MKKLTITIVLDRPEYYRDYVDVRKATVGNLARALRMIARHLSHVLLGESLTPGDGFARQTFGLYDDVATPFGNVKIEQE